MIIPYRSVPELIKYGVIALDKPPGPTSHQVAAWIKRILEIDKVGHGGTLDPGVSGVLVIGLNNSLRVMHISLREVKEYVGIMHLHRRVDEDVLRKTMAEFVGEIYQIPPMRSAVKRRLRKRRVYSLEIIEVDGRDVLFKARVEAGVYIRALCHDIGEALGVGANMQELRRTASGVFSEKDCVTLHELLDSYIFWKEYGEEEGIRRAIKPLEVMLRDFPKIVIKDSAVDAICHGADLMAPGVLEVDGRVESGRTVVLSTRRGEAVAIARALMGAKDMASSTHGVVADVERVIMDRGTYPKMWKSGDRQPEII